LDFVRVSLSDRQAVLLIIVLFCTPVLGSAMGWVATGSMGAAAGAVGLALTFIVSAIAFTVWRKRDAMEVDSDDSGLRIRGAEGGDYLPFSKIRSAWFRSTFGRVTLHVETHAGRRSFSLGEARSEALEAIVSTCVDRSGRPAAPAPPFLASLGKGTETLDAWLRRVQSAASGDSYREHALDVAQLTAFVEDPAGEVELRAAAAHVVVRSGNDAECTERVMNALTNAPPPVVVAAALATKLGTYVPELDQALRCTPPQDRAIAMRMTDERPPR
jgi:hypothetical protein